MKRKHINTLLNVLLIGLITCIVACTSEPDAKAIHAELQNLHNQLMSNGAKIVTNRMKLDTLYRSDLSKKATHIVADTTAEKRKIAALIEQLNLADTEMMDWMHNFNDDFKGTEQESLAYYKSEMVKVHKIDHRYDALTKTSDSVLTVYHVKRAPKMDMPMHKH